MGFASSVKSVFVNYFNFNGNAGRPEFWYFVLFTFLVGVVLGGAEFVAFGEDGTPWLSNLFSLIILIPSISVTVRRLHDIDRSGWWTLLWFVPIVGWGVLIYWHCLPGTTAAASTGALQPA